MKFFALTILLFSAPAFSAPFSNHDRELILEAIDRVCGDSWCENDLTFQFNHVGPTSDQTPGQYVLYFTILEAEAEAAGPANSSALKTQSSVKGKKFTCLLKELHQLSDAVKTEVLNDGRIVADIEPKLYYQVDSCMELALEQFGI